MVAAMALRDGRRRQARTAVSLAKLFFVEMFTPLPTFSSRYGVAAVARRNNSSDSESSYEGDDDDDDKCNLLAFVAICVMPTSLATTTNHQCPTCGRGYSTADHLRRHLIVHDPNRKRYRCQHCGKEYLEVRSLRAHLKKCTSSV